jgi:hypothetical protein
MKLLFLILIIFSNSIAYSQLPSIKANSEKIIIKDGDEWSRGKWTLVPDLKPDTYETTVKKEKEVTFYTDIDSISFIVKPNKYYDFIILLNNKDTCWTRISTIPNFDFTEKYIKEHRNKFSIEIPEVQELIYIVFALTETGINSNYLIDKNSEYYKEVMKEFDGFKNDSLVLALEPLLKQEYDIEIKMDACGFYFQGDEIKKDSIYKTLSWGDKNYIEPYIAQLEAFSKKTKFREFYKKHKQYYNFLINLMKIQTPIQKQWDWLEREFSLNYDNYRIYFSPLTSDGHSSNNFKQEDFKQTAMFVSGPIEKSKRNKGVVEGLTTRVVFTEIDHNYVNPTSDKYNLEINQSFKDLSKWATEDALYNYNSTYPVFNEYMTWAVFTLYAKDNFNETDFGILNTIVENQMSKPERRGFIKFKEFNHKLLEFYINKSTNEKVEDLYPKILKWCNEQ